jgi:hypothetical protein
MPISCLIIIFKSYDRNYNSYLILYHFKLFILLLQIETESNQEFKLDDYFSFILSVDQYFSIVYNVQK